MSDQFRLAMHLYNSNMLHIVYSPFSILLLNKGVLTSIEQIPESLSEVIIFSFALCFFPSQ